MFIIAKFIAKFIDSKGNEIDYMGVWTLAGCLPVSSRYYSQADKISTHGQFFDITPGTVLIDI